MSERFEGIFVSYRRDDSKHAAGRLVDRLATHFGSENLFLDVDSIALGKDFVEVLSAQVEKCQIMLVVIGPGWVDARDASGARRLNSPNDFVRIEVETALNRDIRVIPVLVDGAQPFTEEDLPEVLAPLARRQAIRLDHESFHVDVDRLAGALSAIVVPSRTETDLGTGTGNGTSKPVMSAKDLEDSVAPTTPDSPSTQPGKTPSSPAPSKSKPGYTFGGWLVALSPVIFTALLTAYLFAIGGDPWILEIQERYGNYYMGGNQSEARTIVYGDIVFASAPAALASLWLVVRTIRGRMRLLQILLFLAVATGTWFGAVMIANS